MEYRIFLKNYYLKLKKSLQYKGGLVILLLLGGVLVFGCKSEVLEKKSVVPSDLTRKTVEFHKNGKPKTVELYIVADGDKRIYGFEELYEEGKIKIRGTFDKNHQRDGLWESFYSDGTKWSVGEYTNGVENGEKKVWYPNGKIRYNGEVKEGKPVGRWYFWDEEGKQTIKEY